MRTSLGAFVGLLIVTQSAFAQRCGRDGSEAGGGFDAFQIQGAARDRFRYTP